MSDRSESVDLKLIKNTNTIDLTAETADDGKTCGDFLRGRGVSRRLTAKLKRVPGGITRSGCLIRTVDIVRAGDIISLKAEDERFTEPNGKLSAPVVYEDGDVIVFDKPAGMPVHPSAGHRGDTLGNFFASLYPGLTFRPINRLDKDTSGLCAAAKNPYAASLLNGNISKTYFAVTEGRPVPPVKDVHTANESDGLLINWYESSGGVYVIDAPIGRADASVVRRIVRADGKRAVTRYTILKGNNTHCLVRVVLETGRTHQIRVHFSSVGHPLAGDDFYGGGFGLCRRQALHCGEMRFFRPSDGKLTELFCDIPEDMQI